MRLSRCGQTVWRAGVGLIGLTLALLFQIPSQAAEVDGDTTSGLDGRLTLGLSPEFSSGDYGESRETEAWYVPMSAKYEFSDFAVTSYAHDRLSFKLTVPFIRISGPDEIVWGTGGPIAVGGGRGQGNGPGGPGPTGGVTERDESGLGDIHLTASYLLLSPPGSKLPWWTMAGKVKIPTASESKNLGTGEADYTLFSELYQPVGRLGFFVGGGYRFMGDHDDFSLKNRWLASTGFDVKMTSNLSGGVSYDYREAAVSSSSDAHEVSPWVTIRLGGGLRVEPYGVIGLSSGSPDYGVGVRLSWSTRTGTGRTSSRRRRAPPRPDQVD